LLRGKVLDGFPDTIDRNLPAREFPYRAYAGQAVPDFDQAGSWPFSCHLIEFFSASETLGFGVALGASGRGERCDVVVVIYREDRHIVESPFYGLSRVHDIHHSGTRHNQANSAAFVRGDGNAMEGPHPLLFSVFGEEAISRQHVRTRNPVRN
jgi:hypothetical protein